MNYELHMPSQRGHRPFTTLTWSQSPGDKKRHMAVRWELFLQKQNVMIIDPAAKCVFSKCLILNIRSEMQMNEKSML